MDKQFLKNLKINNYKSFVDFNSGAGIDFAIPNMNDVGSGMTVLIGKNSSGKTSIGTVFTKLKPGARIYDEEKAGLQDVEIIFENDKGKTLTVKNSPGGDKLIKADDGYDLSFETLDIIKDNRVWNSGFNSPESYAYASVKQETDYKRSAIDNSTARRLAAIDIGEPETKWAINKILLRIAPDFVDWEIKGSQRAGEYIAYSLTDGNKLDVDFSIGGGVLNMFRLALSLVEDSSLIFIDEPEAFLHPSAQIELCKILIEYAKSRQIIISSHSPYMFKDTIKTKAKLYIFDKVAGMTVLKDPKELGHRLFGPVSPTWGEINYFAYDLPSVEFHNELYGFIQAKATVQDEANYREDDFDNFLQTKGLAGNRQWLRQNKDTSTTTFSRTLPTFVRNSIHHPENTLNTVYSDDELRQSTERLIAILKSMP